MRTPTRVLFVCTANICRSAFAEIYATAAAAQAGRARDLEFRSAGTWGHPAEPIDPTMARQLTARRIATDGFRSHQVTADDIAWADVVLTMEESHRAFLLDDHPTALTKLFTLGHFATRASGDLHGRALLDDLARHRGRASRSEDVRDPYRRGDDAAAVAGDRIASLVDITITALA